MFIQSISLSAAQGGLGCVPTATICEATEERRTTISIQWADMAPISPGETPAEWVYNLLSRMVENFDDHLVTSIEVEPNTPKGEGPDAA